MRISDWSSDVCSSDLQQPREYRESVLPSSVPARLAVEAGSPQGWHRYVGDRGDVLGVDRFGASAPGSEMLERYGFTVDNVCARVRKLLDRKSTRLNSSH